MRDDGYLELTGRSSGLFKVGGELVAPTQVEQVLTGCQGVAQAYVAGVPDERLGEAGWAWAVAGEGAQPGEAGLLRHCRSHLAPFKVPRKITFLGADELPKTSTGKVQKHLLVRNRPGSQGHAGVGSQGHAGGRTAGSPPAGPGRFALDLNTTYRDSARTGERRAAWRSGTRPGRRGRRPGMP